jgi:aspartate carbamoyltransferase
VADAVAIPVINGGDGSGQHPTQALLDLYTIQKEKGSLEGLTVAMVGDLKYGRTVHSLSYALAPFSPNYVYCSPEELKMPDAVTRDVRARGIPVEETADLRAALAQAHIVYMTRMQRERFEDPAQYERLKGSYILNRELVEKGKPGLIVMHPLPRVDEIAGDVDALPGAAYFRQAHNGVFLRMALLAMVLGKA